MQRIVSYHHLSDGDEREILNCIKKVLDSTLQRAKVILDCGEYKSTIYMEISMGYVITDAHNIIPRNFRTLRQQFSFGYFIYLLNPFTDGLYQHATGCQLLHPTRRHIIIIL